ncbi:hypothetical protein B0H10DRAFT_159742 [Mycena sp. CBHHK59/15]|nr:hypothetical protein B0H10DRAFT_159742 [Mycena sp. CBHHK59/15]
MNTAEIQAQLNSNYYFNLVSFTLLFYDYFLTLEWEIERYWGTKFTWPTALFFANRYGTIAGNVPVVIQYFWSTRGTPDKIRVSTLHRFPRRPVMLIMPRYVHTWSRITSLHHHHAAHGRVMLILRTYALYQRNNRVLSLMVVVSTTGVAIGVWSVISGKAGGADTNLPLYIGCAFAISHAEGVSLAIAWASVVAFDSMIFLLTVYRAMARRRTNSLDLLTVLLRDGSIYFGVMVMSNLSNILTFLLGGAYTRGIATTFTNIVASILINRLMLNLRDPTLSHMSGRYSSATVTRGSVLFARDVLDTTVTAVGTCASSMWSAEPPVMFFGMQNRK